MTSSNGNAISFYNEESKRPCFLSERNRFNLSSPVNQKKTCQLQATDLLNRKGLLAPERAVISIHNKCDYVAQSAV